MRLWVKPRRRRSMPRWCPAPAASTVTSAACSARMRRARRGLCRRARGPAEADARFKLIGVVAPRSPVPRPRAGADRLRWQARPRLSRRHRGGWRDGAAGGACPRRLARAERPGRPGQPRTAGAAAAEHRARCRACGRAPDASRQPVAHAAAAAPAAARPRRSRSLRRAGRSAEPEPRADHRPPRSADVTRSPASADASARVRPGRIP